MRVRVRSTEHPHAGATGRIIGRATGGAAAVGMDWEVRTDGGVFGFFAAAADLQVIGDA
ncbi:hypothetical protein [Pseudonocardia sp. WMMC193]|uniref:hypothetical protein n=1 Tax=Pseudonocardia sp. WMMC193 TaxID=2911965 RepID=UPI001F390EEC|nr:hypothetical protein [Pseudonocardia sp. WMMC193]MCF7551009.1 hypothetical protein [Pseudonocardia sp. WMMC193]